MPIPQTTISLHVKNAGLSINQSIKIYIAPLQDPYSDALPAQVKRKRTVYNSMEENTASLR